MQKKVISFSIDGLGLCTSCSSGVLFEEEAPDNWDEMSKDEQEEYAKDVFFGNFIWSFQVKEQEK